MHTDCFTEASLDYAGIYSERLCIDHPLTLILSFLRPRHTFGSACPKHTSPVQWQGFSNACSLLTRARSSMGMPQRLSHYPIAVGLINTFLQPTLPTVPHQWNFSMLLSLRKHPPCSHMRCNGTWINTEHSPEWLTSLLIPVRPKWWYWWLWLGLKPTCPPQHRTGDSNPASTQLVKLEKTPSQAVHAV